MSDILFSIFPSHNYIDLDLLQFGWQKCKPGHSFGPAKRNHYLFHYILSGKGKLMSTNYKGDTITYDVHAGEGFLIFPNQMTTYIADSKNPWEYTWIEFDGLRVKEALDASTIEYNYPIYNPKNREPRDKMKDEMLYIVKNNDKSPFNLIGHTYLFLDYLIASSPRITPIKSSKMSDYYIKEAITYMEQNYHKNISIEDISEVCGINRSYFGKIFKDSIGKTPQEFLINYRMIKATELLKMTKKSIAEISESVGYENQLHFSRAFKKIYNMSPRNWRNAH